MTDKFNITSKKPGIINIGNNLSDVKQNVTNRGDSSTTIEWAGELVTISDQDGAQITLASHIADNVNLGSELAEQVLDAVKVYAVLSSEDLKTQMLGLIKNLLDISDDVALKIVQSYKVS